MRRMVARGVRGTRGLAERTRDQVKVLTESMGRVVKAVDVLRTDANALGETVADMSRDVAKLGGLMEAYAEASDEHQAELEAVHERLAALEKKAGRK